MLNKKKIIVTGGCGFLGSHLVDKLIDKGFSVFVIDNLSTGSLENLNKKQNFIFQILRINFKCQKFLNKQNQSISFI